MRIIIVTFYNNTSNIKNISHERYTQYLRPVSDHKLDIF